MLCSQCRDVHAGNGLGARDGGVSFGLGNCVPHDGSKPGAHAWVPTRFVMDIPVIQTFGRYDFMPFQFEAVRTLIQDGRSLVSAVANEKIAWFASKLLGVEIPVCKCRTFMDVGDEALVFLVFSDIVLPEELKQMPEKPHHDVDFKIGLLRRLG